MYLNGPKRRLGQDENPVFTGLSAPVTVSVSPLVLAGAGLLALAFILSGTKKAAGAVVRKGRAVRRALKA